MTTLREIHPDFLNLLLFKESSLIELFTDLREFVLEIYPDSNELLYHTHALTSVFSITEKMGNAFCMLPIYSNHVNLGFSKGTLLGDPSNLLSGTGSLIRHIPISKRSDYRNRKVRSLVESAVEFAIKDSEGLAKIIGMTISKIKTT